ncbi:hypothetical protein R3X26_12040 [Vibrio sp. TH_r3]|uniref:hypothetical protein n=1 Tax=Vibrio sp. TH_r3 TaxID=3082084 RepID=UPI0029548291|nr:hypothetical protein [Vibrio sp. TH_r3]MDV7105133.1 hypothetical protein [Vibrio sp. TH_r3]
MIDKNEREISVGGPEVLSIDQIASLAFDVQKRTIKVIYLSDVLRKAILFIAARVPERFGGAVESFLTVAQKI